MRGHWLKKLRNWNRVPGGQGSPHGLDCGPLMTPGSTMNRFALVPATSGAFFSKVCLRLALLAVLAAVGFAGVRLYAESANSDFKQGQTAEAREDYDTAYTDFQKAFQKNPKELRFRTALDRVRVTASTTHMTKGRKLLQSGETTAALSEFLRSTEIDPGNEAAQQEIAKLRQQQGQAPQPGAEAGLPRADGQQEQLDSMAAPTQLRPVSNEPLTLHMTEDAKVIYQAIGKAAGVNVLFDPDYTSKRVQIDLNNVSLLDALHIVGAMSGTFWRPITSNTIFVAQNTRTKRTEIDVQAVQTFYLTNAWQQNDLNDVQTALRNVLPNAKVYGVASQNAIVMRATPDELLLAAKLINDLDKPRSEVVVDIGVLEVSKNWEKNLGISWPSTVSVALQNPTSTSSTTSTTSTTSTGSTSTSSVPSLYQLAHLNANDFAVTVGSATLNALLSDGNTQILQDPRIRATDGQKATLTVGSKIPIATGSYSTPGVGGASSIGVGYAQTQFQYIDVGVKVEMTPTVHFDDDVTLKMHIEVSSESGQATIEGVTEPILSQRVIDQVIRLKEGEASILGGIQDKEDQQSMSGIPGLSSIPILKYLFGSHDHQIKDDEVVFVVVPHVVRSQELNQQNLRSIDTGSGQTIELRRIDSSSPAAAPAARPAVIAHPAVGTVQGSSAPAAAMSALQQMRTASDSMEPAPPIAQSTPQITQSPGAPGVPPSPFEASAKAQVAPATATPAPASAVPATVPPAAIAPTAPATSTAPPTPSAGPVFKINPPPAITLGGSVQIPILLSSAANVASIPLQLHYDTSKLTLVNVVSGDFLSRDGQAVALIHRDDGQGNVTIVASRPPGTTGVFGDGTVCTLTFQAKAPGESTLSLNRAGAVDSNQQQLTSQGTQVSIMVK